MAAISPPQERANGGLPRSRDRRARNGDRIGDLEPLFSSETCSLLAFKPGRVPVEKERVRDAPASGVMGKPKERTECRTVV
jgi:hypothetical protein